jgi:ABC-type Fe3+-hydroxamate transport system substrate-binding protein
VAVESTRNWKNWLNALAVATNAEAESQQALTAYQTRVNSLKTDLAGTTVSVVRPKEENILLYGPRSNAGVVLADLGLIVQELPGEVEDWGGDGMRAIGQMSLELIPQLTGEHLFVISYDIKDTTVDALLAQPLWRQTPAIRQNNVHPVEGTAWTNHGFHGAMLLIDEVEAALKR